MEVDCEGCAGCCIDWRALADADVDHERRGDLVPLDDTYNLAPLSRDEVRAFVAAGYGDALVPRLFRADDAPSVAIEGPGGSLSVAAIGGRPAFFVGLRKVPKPVAPFGADATWLPTCAFLDPDTLQCRIHDSDLYPETCERYPGENLTLDVETECERVERVHDGERLLDDEAPGDATPLFGPAAVGSKVFGHPDTDRLSGAVERLRGGHLTREDRAEFVAVAAASAPGMLVINDERYEQALEDILAADSWVGRAIDEWTGRAGGDASAASLGATVEESEGAPPTPGWDGVGTDN